VWTLLLRAATVRSFAHLPLRIYDCNKMVLWPGCKGRARCRLHKKNVRSVQFVEKGGDVVATFLLSLRWMRGSPLMECARRTTPIYMEAQTSNNRVIMACELYCCMLPQSEALRTCHSGFPIATEAESQGYWHLCLTTVLKCLLVTGFQHFS